MAPTPEVDLVAVDLTGEAAEHAVRAAWDRDEAVYLVDPGLSAPARAAAEERVRPTAVVTATGRRTLNGVPVPATCAAVVETSGTGASPRAVMLTRPGMEAMARSYSAAIGAGDDDVWLAALPPSGVAGLAVLARAYVTGVPVRVLPRFETAAVAAAAAQRSATIVSLVPTTLVRLLDASAPLDRFRVVLVGGGPLPAHVAARALRANVPVVTTYGMTETWGGVALDGLPIEGAAVRVGERHEIQVAGPMVMAGYRFDPEGSDAAFTPDGWLRTGDAGSWDGTRLRVTDRLRDLIVTGGSNVSPTAVEAVLAERSDIADLCVAGVPDAEWGEAVTVFVVPSDATRPPRLGELRAAVKERLPGPSAPRRLELVDAIPRNTAGKALRRQLIETLVRRSS